MVQGAVPKKKKYLRTLVKRSKRKKIKNKILFLFPGVPYVHFVLNGPGSRSLKKKLKKER
jgi:hypothetical protein